MEKYRVLLYSGLKYSRVRAQFKRVVGYLETGDFAAGEVKKMGHQGYYRAKLDRENRLLFTLGRYQGETCLLILEVILNHDYAKSRFLRGAKIDESKLEDLNSLSDAAEEDVNSIAYLNPKQSVFYVLDRAISFDDAQRKVLTSQVPLVIIGSAGSGKTVLTLAKMQNLKGNILYVTHSPFLIENASRLYYSNNFANDAQEIDFLSFQEFVQTIRIPEGKEVSFRIFNQWFSRHRQASGIRDSHKLFEEFKGVLTGAAIDKGWLDRSDYLKLGVRQSIFLDKERSLVYDLFEKYLAFLKKEGLYDLNIVSWNCREECKALYDFVVVDEVQDFTNVQLDLVLRSLKKPDTFILSGDSNQIVHPNFFSWTGLRAMFYQREETGKMISILQTNYRNTPEITNLANRLLRIKQARFGSIDRESNYLVKSVSKSEGEVNFLENDKKILKELNHKTQKSRKFAVVVMRDEDKDQARRIFQTPLLFSVREAKGLEYENIILVNFVSGHAKEFREIVQGVTLADIETDSELTYSRAKEKKDKSLEAYKFYVNSMYVAITRSVKSIFIIEESGKHEILSLLGLVAPRKELNLSQQESSSEEWKEEARRLELQGKAEQASLIREQILGTIKPDWVPLTKDTIGELKQEALNPKHFNKKAKEKLFAYSLLYNDMESIKALAALKFKRAERPEEEEKKLYLKYYRDYQYDNLNSLTKKLEKYGVDYRDQFNRTPLMAALGAGSLKITRHLLKSGANSGLTDNLGRSGLRIALLKAHDDEGFRNSVLSESFPELQSESIKVKVDGRLVKIDNRKAEYFFLNFFISLQVKIDEEKMNDLRIGLTTSELVAHFGALPECVLPDFRRKRSYINSILSKNEISGNSPYNKKLFLRLARGYYVVNPDLGILDHEKWCNVYDFMPSEPITPGIIPDLLEARMLARRKKVLEIRRNEIRQPKGKYESSRRRR